MIFLNYFQEKVILGPDPDAGQTYFTFIPPGRWFVRRLEAGDVTDRGEREALFSLIGCTVVPGYDDRDIETKTLGEIRRGAEK